MIAIPFRDKVRDVHRRKANPIAQNVVPRVIIWNNS